MSFLRMSREEIIVRLVNVFRHYGYEGTSLSQLSKVTGLGKASLYHHFPGGKEEMAEAALSYIDSWLEANILKPLSSEDTPLERLRVMSQQVETFYEGGQKPCIWAIFALGESNDRFHNQIKRALSLWINTLASVLQEAGIDEEKARCRAEEAILRIQGALVLARGLNDTTPFKRTMQNLPEELLKDSVHN